MHITLIESGLSYGRWVATCAQAPEAVIVRSDKGDALLDMLTYVKAKFGQRTDLEIQVVTNGEIINALNTHLEDMLAKLPKPKPSSNFRSLEAQINDMIPKVVPKEGPNFIRRNASPFPPSSDALRQFEAEVRTLPGKEGYVLDEAGVIVSES